MWRIASQMPLAEKARFADYLIDNSGSTEETAHRVREIHDRLRALEMAVEGESEKRD
jgi:dephospho-CoA kinase